MIKEELTSNNPVDFSEMNLNKLSETSAWDTSKETSLKFTLMTTKTVIAQCKEVKSVKLSQAY